MKKNKHYFVLLFNTVVDDWLLVAEAINTLFAGLSLVLKYKAAAPFVSKINV